MKHSISNRLPILLASFLFLGLHFSTSAQSISGDSIKAQFVKDWERAKSYTMEYLNAMPADKYSFKAVDSIRSFAQQMLHLSAANLSLVSAASGGTPPFSPEGLEGRATAQTKDSVVSYVTQSYDFAIAGAKAIDPNKLGEMTGRGNFKQTRFNWWLKAFEHQTHHRGQTTIYIRLLGIRPPGERLF
ncbi:MAG TPA: DinB family protein [Puia sp.]|nr:DinB family protein [Puia sp.]